MAPQSPPRATASKRYTLSFVAMLVNKRHPNSALSKEKKEDAKEAIENASWREYLTSSMKGADVDEVSLKILSQEDAEEKGVGRVTNFKGEVSWTSRSMDMAELEEEIQWWIGDRMSQYEIDEPGWHIFFTPGKPRGH